MSGDVDRPHHARKIVRCHGIYHAAAACPSFGSSRSDTLVWCCAHRNVGQTNVGAGGRYTNQQRANGDAHWRQVDAGCLSLDETGRDVERDGVHNHTCKSSPRVTRSHMARRGHSLACPMPVNVRPYMGTLILMLSRLGEPELQHLAEGFDMSERARKYSHVWRV